MNAWVHVTGWVLLHFVWQGSVLALAAAVGMRVVHSSSSAIRYGIASVTLSAMLAAPLITAFALARSLPDEISAVVPTALSPDGQPATAIFNPTDEAAGRLATGLRTAAIESIFPFIVPLWLAGVTLFLARTGAGWYRVRQLQKTALASASSKYQASTERIATSLGLRKIVHVVELANVDVPTVIGWIRPVILLPIAALSHLSPLQVEAILAHELAHVRRHDYVVNVLQTLVETVLFYHPAVWWVSARIREEREHCCDDRAIQLCGDAVEYATALTELETWRTADAALGLAATDGPLLKRMRRILRVPIADQPRTASTIPMILLTVFFAVGSGGLQRSPTVIAQASSTIADAFRTQWYGVRGGGSVASEGSIIFVEDLSDVRTMSDNGVLSIESRQGRPSRRAEIRTENGRVIRRYFVDDIEQPWTDEARRWLAAELPFFVRRSGVAANERVRQILTDSGVSGVLDEIRRLYTNSVRGRYVRALLAARRLTPEEVNSALTLAGNLIDSSAELSETLRAALEAAPLESGDGFFDAFRHMSSSMEKRRVLMALLEQPGLSPSLQKGLLGAAADIESNLECANVLEAFAARYPVSDQATRDLFMAALETVNSTSERNRVFTRVMTYGR